MFLNKEIHEGDKRSLQRENHSSLSVLLYGLHFLTHFTCITAIESFEYVDYASLNNEGSEAKML